MVTKEELARDYESLRSLNPNRLTLVRFAEGQLEFKQLGVSILAPNLLKTIYIDNKVGILYSEDFINFMQGLLELIEDQSFNSGNSVIVPVKFGFKVENHSKGLLINTYSLSFRSSSNWFHKFLIKLVSKEARKLLKSVIIKNEGK